jgi:steroid 5-alpha reductase family enzyme
MTSYMLTGALVLVTLFTVAWFIQLRTHNGAIADVAWAFGFPLVTAVYTFIDGDFGVRKIILLILTLLWGARLGIYLFVRAISKPEDVRYTALRQEWGSKQNLMMLRFYYFQAILAWLLCFQFLIIVKNAEAELDWNEFAGIALWIIGFAGETIADAQLKRFKDNPSNKGKVCDDGLWFYSRHPNYFFEWLIWVSYFVMSLNAPYGVVTIFCPLAMLYFLTKVTGIVYTENQMLKSKGEAFRRYQQSTSSFIPLPKKILS